jgi:hypothetical protein
MTYVLIKKPPGVAALSFLLFGDLPNNLNPPKIDIAVSFEYSAKSTVSSKLYHNRQKIRIPAFHHSSFCRASTGGAVVISYFFLLSHFWPFQT